MGKNGGFWKNGKEEKVEKVGLWPKKVGKWPNLGTKSGQKANSIGFYLKMAKKGKFGPKKGISEGRNPLCSEKVF